MSLETEVKRDTGGLRPEYKTYKRQKCFVGHSREAEWRDDILSACAEVLPKFGLEPWYAANQFDPTKPLRDKVVELIANARYGIYDLSSWQDRDGEWRLPRNVFIELGMAIALNRPALLLCHTSNKALPLPACLQGVELLEFAGEMTLQRALEERLPQWFEVPPDRDWLNHLCVFGNRVCSFRKVHPRARQWGYETLRCHILDGLDKDHPGFQAAEREEIRGAFQDILSRYSDLDYDYLDELPLTGSYQFALCGYCQAVRSMPLAVYRVLPGAPVEVFISIGMSIALEVLLGYEIPRVILVRQERELPSLLRGYEVIEAVNTSEVKRKLRAAIPTVMQQVRETAWSPKPLPFVEVISEAIPRADQEASVSELPMELPKIVAIKLDIYTLACRELLNRLADLRNATRADLRLTYQTCVQRFNQALHSFFVDGVPGDVDQGAKLFGDLLQAQASLFRAQNKSAAAIFDNLVDAIHEKVPFWSYRADLERFHVQGRDLARRFFVGSPWSETHERLGRECYLVIEYGAPDISFGHRLAPLAYRISYQDEEHAQLRNDVLLVRFDFNHDFFLYLAYPFLFLHEYTAHVYATDYLNECFNDGWMLHAADAFLVRKAWTITDLNSEQVTVFGEHLYPNLALIPRRGCRFARGFDAWLGSADAFMQITYELAAFRPEPGETVYWPNQFINALEGEFETSRPLLRRKIQESANVRDLMASLSPV